VLVPAVLGALAVWIQNQKYQKAEGINTEQKRKKHKDFLVTGPKTCDLNQKKTSPGRIAQTPLAGTGDSGPISPILLFNSVQL